MIEPHLSSPKLDKIQGILNIVFNSFLYVWDMTNTYQRNHPLLAHIAAVREMIDAMPETLATAKYKPFDLTEAFVRVDPQLAYLDDTRQELRHHLKKLHAIYSVGEPMLDMVAEELEDVERAYLDRLMELRANLIARKKAMQLIAVKEAAEAQELEEKEARWRVQKDAERAERLMKESAEAQKPKETSPNSWGWLMIFLVADQMFRADREKILSLGGLHARFKLAATSN